jgi:hypothetical protein
MKRIQAILMATLSIASVSTAATFQEDVEFLQRHTEIIVLEGGDDGARVAVAPAWQGRVMTSAAGGGAGMSFGWINRELIGSGKILPHINVFGGEDRFWLGPEGGQFSIFFARGAKFDLADWQTPAPIDTLPFKVEAREKNEVEFSAEFSLTNYSGTVFEVEVERSVKLLESADAWKKLGLRRAKDVTVVAYESHNEIENVGRKPWRKETGLLSIWILGMFNPSPAATIVAPIAAGPDSKLGRKVTSDYFGEVPADRLEAKEDVIYFSADGQCRSKIGISPRRSKGVIGSYDADNKVLTIVQFSQPKGVGDYVNSLWKLQENPYGGDAANAYNDGPPSPGAKPLGPFYELESSSPAAALASGKSLSHVHRTIHLSGPEVDLDAVARKVLGVSLAQIKSRGGN